MANQVSPALKATWNLTVFRIKPLKMVYFASLKWGCTPFQESVLDEPGPRPKYGQRIFLSVDDDPEVDRRLCPFADIQFVCLFVPLLLFLYLCCRQRFVYFCAVNIRIICSAV